MADWLTASKGGPPPLSSFGVSGPYAEWLVLGAIAYRVPGKLEWDSANLRFTNSEEANRYVRPTFRPRLGADAVGLVTKRARPSPLQCECG